MRFMPTSLMELGRHTTRSMAARQTRHTNKSWATDLHGFTRILQRNLVLIRGDPCQSVAAELVARRASRPTGQPPGRRGYLILREFLHRKEQIVGLGKHGIFQDGLVGDEHVFGGHAANGGVELVEKLVG